MRDYYWLPWEQRFEERVLAGIFLLAFLGVAWVIVEVFKWVVSLF